MAVSDSSVDATCRGWERECRKHHERTRDALDERLVPARGPSGRFTLRELEGAAEDIAGWRAALPDTARYRLTGALRQALGAAVRWGYLRNNPAVDAGRNRQPRKEEIWPFTRDQVDARAQVLEVPGLQGFLRMGRAGLEPATSGLSSRRSPS
jgi:hypothetical protein